MGILENPVIICTISNQKFKESENQSTITMNNNNKTANIFSIFSSLSSVGVQGEVYALLYVYYILHIYIL